MFYQRNFGQDPNIPKHKKNLELEFRMEFQIEIVFELSQFGVKAVRSKCQGECREPKEKTARNHV